MAGVTTYQVDETFTADDLDDLPDDGQRYELVDRELLVSPSPRLSHQAVVVNLAVLLAAAVPPGLRLLVAPMDVRFGPRRQLQPDLLVVRDEGLDAVRVESVPLLVVEVLSRGTRRRDQVLKRRVYEQEGVPSYWVVDPDVPSLLALQLGQGRYREAARVAGDQAWTASAPFPVEVVPALLRR